MEYNIWNINFFIKILNKFLKIKAKFFKNKYNKIINLNTSFEF